MEPSPADVTSLLNRLAAGDQEAATQLIPLVYDELRHLAARRLRQERPDHTLQATALVHEVYVKLCGPERCKMAEPGAVFRRGFTSDASNPGRLRTRTTENPAGRQAAKGVVG